MRHKPILSVVTAVVLVASFSCLPISASAAEIRYIKAEELNKLIESNDSTILVVDVQPKVAYELGHIKGAVNFPWAVNIERPRNLPRDKTLILYCDCGPKSDSSVILQGLTEGSDFCPADDDSTDVADQLMTKFDYRNIKILEGGWSRWVQLGYPLEKK